MREDAIRAASAAALDAARPSLKRLAAAGGVSVSRASRWCSEGTGSPVHAFFSLMDALAEMDADAASTLLVHADALLQRHIMSADTHTLVQRFWSLVNQENQSEAAENGAFGEFARTGDLRGYAAALKAEASVQVKLAAICEELAERDVDPRTWR